MKHTKLKNGNYLISDYKTAYTEEWLKDLSKRNMNGAGFKLVSEDQKNDFRKTLHKFS